MKKEKSTVLSNAMAGNTNRQIGDIAREATIHLRVDLPTKNRFVQNARNRGQSLSAWALEAMELLYEQQQREKEK